MVCTKSPFHSSPNDFLNPFGLPLNSGKALPVLLNDRWHQLDKQMSSRLPETLIIRKRTARRSTLYAATLPRPFVARQRHRQ